METIKNIINQVEELKEEFNQYRPIPNDRMNRIMQKLRLEWNFNSNSMEGNTLTKPETQNLIFYGITAKGKPLRDHLEMKGHDKALKKLEQIIHKDLKLTESLIKEFHRMILEESESLKEDNVEINPGEWKKYPNYLHSPTGERIDFASPEEVPNLMSSLINWTNNHLYQDDLNRHSKKKYDLHPLVVACIFHKRFIDIHPFGDGNGRMGRILMNLVLMQNGFMPVIVPLESRDAYYLALNNSSSDNMEPLVTYIGENLKRSMILAIEGAKGNSITEEDDWEKEMDLLKRKIQRENKQIALITWSPENQEKILKDVILPTLSELSTKLNKLQQGLFEKGYWEEKSLGIGDINVYDNIDLLLKRITNNPFSKELIHFNYVLEKFQDFTKEYNVIISFKLIFKDDFYSLIALVGDGQDRSFVSQLAKTVAKSYFGGTDDVIEVELYSNSLYNKHFNANQITKRVTKVMNSLISYIKSR